MKEHPITIYHHLAASERGAAIFSITKMRSREERLLIFVVGLFLQPHLRTAKNRPYIGKKRNKTRTIILLKTKNKKSLNYSRKSGKMKFRIKRILTLIALPIAGYRSKAQTSPRNCFALESEFFCAAANPFKRKPSRFAGTKSKNLLFAEFRKADCLDMPLKQRTMI